MPQRKDSFVRDWFFSKVVFNLSKDVLVSVMCSPAELNTSSINEGLKLLKYLKVIELIHCLNRSFMGIYLIFSNLDKSI